jgi:hypothetical protein
MLRDRYQFSLLDSIEDIELNEPGGLHLVSIGDVFANGCYTKYCTSWVTVVHLLSGLHETRARRDSRLPRGLWWH